jgi:hypothetical protein
MVPALRKFAPLIVLAATAALTAAGFMLLPQTLYLPAIELSMPGGIEMRFYARARTDEASCRAELSRMKSSIPSNCQQCKTAEHCYHGLEDERRRILADVPIDIASARREDGALTTTFSAPDANVALAICMKTEEASKSSQSGKRLKCFPAGATRKKQD